MRYRVSVTPSARREKIVARADDSFTISVKEPAQRGVANARVQALLARHLGVAAKSLRLVKGHRGKNKLFELV